MENKICHIFGAGEYFDLPPTIYTGDYVIAADGGYNYLERNGIAADLVVGDFDSCETPPEGINVIVLPKEKDNTDMSAAIQIGFEKGFKNFHIYGGVGGRIDHTLANIQCIVELAGKGARGFLFDRDTVITAIKNSRVCFGADASGYVSVFAHSDTAIGVYERGLKYLLDNATLHNTNSLGISNEFIGTPCSISVLDGSLVIIYSKHIHEVCL